MNVITHTFVGPKCLTETKIQILCDHVDHTRFHIVEMGCQMVQLLSAHIYCWTNNVRQFDPSLTSKNLENVKQNLSVKYFNFYFRTKVGLFYRTWYALRIFSSIVSTRYVK